MIKEKKQSLFWLKEYEAYLLEKVTEIKTLAEKTIIRILPKSTILPSLKQQQRERERE